MKLSTITPFVACVLSCLCHQGYGAPDALETNDTLPTATPVDIGTRDAYFTSLSIHSYLDEDWFRVEAPPTPFSHVQVEIVFSHAAGDLDMAVLDADGHLIAESQTTSDNETLLVGNSGEAFYVRVYGYGGAVQPDYTLSVRAFDGYEFNDTQGSATHFGNIGEQAQIQMSLSLSPGDVDWLRMEVPRDGHVLLGITHYSDPFAGDVTFEVYDSGGNYYPATDRFYSTGTYFIKCEPTNPGYYRYTFEAIMDHFIVTNLSPAGGAGSLHEAIEWANTAFDDSTTAWIDLTDFPCETLVLSTSLPTLNHDVVWLLPELDPFGIICAPGDLDPVPEVLPPHTITYMGTPLARGKVDPADLAGPNDDWSTPTPLTIPGPESGVYLQNGYTLAPKGDHDWYGLQSALGGEVNVQIHHRECLGGINALSLDASGVLKESFDTGDIEEILVPLQPGIPAHVRVHGVRDGEPPGDTVIGYSPGYDIWLEFLDRFEPNETWQTAAVLPDVPEGTGATTELTLAAYETDWYAFDAGRGLHSFEIVIPPPGLDVDVAFRVYYQPDGQPPVNIGQDLDDSDGLHLDVQLFEDTRLFIELTDLRSPSVGPTAGFFYELATDFTPIPEAILVTNLEGGSQEGSLHAAMQQLNEIPIDYYNVPIIFSDLSGTLYLQEPLPTITRHMEIMGPHADCLAIDGQGAFRIFHAPEALLEIRDLTLRNGLANDGRGGGAFLGFEVILNGVIIENCVSESPGGAIDAGYVGLDKCIIRDCQAPSGGAIRDTDYSLIVRSSLYRNIATEGDGGALYHDPATIDLTIAQSTFSGNIAAGRGGAIYIADSSVTTFDAYHITITNNTASEGGGVYVPPEPAIPILFYLYNSIIAGNEADTDPQISEPIRIYFEENGFTNLFQGDPHLAPLDYYGGPTPCHALWPDSVAIDASGSGGGLLYANDQRGSGYDRVVNGIPDLGAFESGQDPRTYPLWSIYALRMLKTEPGARPEDDYNGDGVSNLRHYAHFRDGNTPYWVEPRLENFVRMPSHLLYQASIPYRLGEDLFFSWWYSLDLESSYYFDWYYHQAWNQCGSMNTPFEGVSSSPGSFSRTQTLRLDGAWVYSLECEIQSLDKIFFFDRIDLRTREP
jgi:predicted outer membrane repeat protein